MRSISAARRRGGGGMVLFFLQGFAKQSAEGAREEEVEAGG